jgi:hypothetical protein
LTALTGLAFLAVLSGLVARLSALLTSLTTLLFIFLHIVCHEIVLLFQSARLGASVIKVHCYNLVAYALSEGWELKTNRVAIRAM